RSSTRSRGREPTEAMGPPKPKVPSQRKYLRSRRSPGRSSGSGGPSGGVAASRSMGRAAVYGANGGANEPSVSAEMGLPDDGRGRRRSAHVSDSTSHARGRWFNPSRAHRKNRASGPHLKT